MLRLLLAFLSILHIARCDCPKFTTIGQCNCPDSFELVREGECRGLWHEYNCHSNDYVTEMAQVCTQTGLKPVIIHTEEEHSYWGNKSLGYYDLVPIGIVCNANTKKYEWVDGSRIDFKPPSYDKDLDGDCSKQISLSYQLLCVWYYSGSSDWKKTCGEYSWNVYCIGQLPPIVRNFCEDKFAEDTDDELCFQVSPSPKKWQDAQKDCRNQGSEIASIHNQQENSFVRRLAVSRGAVNGLFLGATRSAGADFTWSDGSNWDYGNLYPADLLNEQGDCLVMDTFSAAGEWLNYDCSAPLPYACVRSDPIPACTAGPWEEGEEITSPGYPYDASMPCDYMITVDPKRHIKLEILELEANSCCDFLVITDQKIGGRILANVTGRIIPGYSEKTTFDSSSNFMRVSWQPTGGVNVKGLRMKFTSTK